MANIESLKVVGTSELVRNKLNGANSVLEEEAEGGYDISYSALASHIRGVFQTNKDARRDSGVEDEILDSLRSYNGEYNPRDLAIISREGGSSIFMNLTATKCRAACSWIRDILMGKEIPFSINPTTLPSLPDDIIKKIDAGVREEFESIVSSGPQNPTDAQKTIRELNRTSRDIKEGILAEIRDEAKFQIKQVEDQIIDQLEEGDWNSALSDFIEDFSVVPTAFMKGPIITKKVRLKWVNGEPVQEEDYVYINKRVSPLDMYPSPSATTLHDGDIIEHMRFSPRELQMLRNAAGYKTEAINQVLEEYSFGYTGYDLDTGIEDEIAEEEKRGDSTKANKGVIHGLHFHGSVSNRLLNDWGLEVPNGDEYGESEVEAILVGSQVIKCKINDDPLKRRPYYKASWQNRPGSFWGRSLPNLMSDIQRICNATARALSNNMGLASGPQIELYVDRLADDGDIEDIRPFRIWQFTSDPTGGTGRAIQFNQPTSNAGELLAVYREFEQKADDATGIPRYAYGNERSAGAAATASGLSMLLESASKSIKDAIRHIDDGVIKPRIEYQFYHNMLKNPIPNFTGDVAIVAKGSSSLTIKGAEQMRRNEFLQITANPVDLEIIGKEGRAEILRRVAEDLNLPYNVVPTRLELIDSEKKKAAAQQQQMEMESQKNNKSLEATNLQIQGQMAMAAEVQQTKRAELSLKQEKQDAEVALKIRELDQKAEDSRAKVSSSMAAVNQKDQAQKREAAIKLRTGEGF